MAKSRAEEAGNMLGMAICEMVHLMYQKNTAINFLRGLVNIVEIELQRRLHEKHGNVSDD